MKKIVVVGGTGTLGKAIVPLVAARHEVIVAGFKHGDIQVDITQPESIRAMYQAIGHVDAVIACVGKVHFGLLTDMNADLYQVGLMNKLMGQVNLVTLGLPYVNDGGSFTLTSGILNVEPIKQGSSAAMVNGGLDSFVKAAAIELPRGLRINVISPTVFSESIENYGDFFAGFEPVPVAKAALAYIKSVEGAQTGQVYRVGY